MRQELSGGESENWLHTVFQTRPRAEADSYVGYRWLDGSFWALWTPTYSALDLTVSLTISSLWLHIHELSQWKPYEANSYREYI